MRVLLIEDDSATAQSIELMLKSESFNVYTTDLGEEGIDLGKIYDYDIILLDLNLPDMSGFEVLRSLRVSKVKTPILILSGLAGIEGGLEPPPADDEPYAAARPLLPKSLPEALDALDKEPLFRRELGDTFIDYFLKLKRTEVGRYLRSLEQSGTPPNDDEPSAWEQNEYFDFF